MPITASAKKANRQSASRRDRNLKVKQGMKSAIKNYKKLVAEKKIAEARATLPRVQQVLDKAAKAGTIKKNTASRLKSRLDQLTAKSTRASS